MLSYIEPLYKEQAFRIFQIYKVMSPKDDLFGSGVSPLDLDLAVTANVRDTLAPDTEALNETEIDERCERMDIHLKTRCAGLLEIHALRKQTELPSTVRDRANVYTTSKVQYLHRSVREFLETEEVRMMLSSSSDRDAVLEANKAILMLQIIRLKRLERWQNDFPTAEGSYYDGMKNYIAYALHFARAADDHSASYVALLDHLDRVASRLWQRQTPGRNVSALELKLGHHWSAAMSMTYGDEKNCNFLSQAIKNGLYSYVDAKLKEDKSLLVRKRGRSYLDYAVEACYRGTPDSSTYDMIHLLLQNGADPSALWRGNTPWQRLLTWIHGNCSGKEELGRRDYFNEAILEDVQVLRFRARVITLLLEKRGEPLFNLYT
jgi:hypothetical protein